MALFDGETYEPEVDEGRLKTQQERVLEAMRDGVWRTPEEVMGLVAGSGSSITARIRDLRKLRWGSWRVTSRRRAGQGGSWEYQVLPPLPPEPRPVQGALDLGMEG